MNRLHSSQACHGSADIQTSKGQLLELGSFAPTLLDGSPQAFFLPSRYEPNYRYPLIVWLHHQGGCEQQVAQVMPHISVQNYVGVGIRGTRACDPGGHRFDWVHTGNGILQAEQLVMDAIEQATERFSIHPERIFLAGYRSGGVMAQRLGLMNPHRFAGVVSLGGGLPRGGRPLARLNSLRGFRLLLAQAIESERFSLEQFEQDLRLINAAKLHVEVRQVTCEDEMIAPVLRHIDHWLMSLVTGQSLPESVPDWDTVPVEFSEN